MEILRVDDYYARNNTVYKKFVETRKNALDLYSKSVSAGW